MLECRACVQHFVRAFIGSELRGIARSRAPLLLTPRLSRPIARRYASTNLAASDGAADVLVPGKQAEAEEKDNSGLSLSEKKALQKELDYLPDVVKLAEHIQHTLKLRNPAKALNLCRLASKKREVIVSWNFCVDYYMRQGKVDDAIKVYNEMKKRAQFPDSYTYVILLRGLAHPSQLKDGRVREQNVVKAVSIYNSMSSPTSRVKPGIFHTNAVLNVCSAALDMDALWGVASRLPSSGPGSPDHQTYTILLNAIRHGTFGNFSDTPSFEQLATRRKKAVEEGRRIWLEVIPKWRAGEIQIDEELVCVMGKLLLASKSMHDWDDVFNLIQQTMNIERLVPALGHPDRQTQHVPQHADVLEADPEAEHADGYRDAPSTKAFNRVKPLPADSAYPDRAQSLAWVKPGNRALSILINASLALRTPKTATAYWDLLTSFGVKPDLTNFHDQLKLLSINRASAKAASLLTNDLVAAGIEPKFQTFRIAMSVCMRDKNNKNVLDHARTIIDVMEKTSPDPDLQTLEHYLSLALLTDDGKKIAAVLDRLDPIVHNLRSMVTYGLEQNGGRTEKQRAERLAGKTDQTIQFFQTLVGVIDTLMNRGLVPREDYTHWHGRRSQLTQFIGRGKDRVEGQRRKLESESSLPTDGKRVGREQSAERKGLPPMSKTAWSLRVLRYKDKQAGLREKNRQRAVGVNEWNRQRAVEVNEWNPQKNWNPQKGFADSPMELGSQ